MRARRRGGVKQGCEAGETSSPPHAPCFCHPSQPHSQAIYYLHWYAVSVILIRRNGSCMYLLWRWSPGVARGVPAGGLVSGYPPLHTRCAQPPGGVTPAGSNSRCTASGSGIVASVQRQSGVNVSMVSTEQWACQLRQRPIAPPHRRTPDRSPGTLRLIGTVAPAAGLTSHPQAIAPRAQLRTLPYR